MVPKREATIEDIVSLTSAGSLARRPYHGNITISEHDLPRFNSDDSYKGRRFNIRKGKDTLDFHKSIADICKEARHTGKHEKLVSAVYEAFRNAYQHGNKKNPEKAIEINYRATEDGFEVVISDEGGEINANFVPFILVHRQGMNRPLSFYDFAPGVPRLGENSGNGTFVIHTVADEVNYFVSPFGGLSVQIIVRKSK